MNSCVASSCTLALAPQRFRTHSQLRFPGQPATRHSAPALLSVARHGTKTPNRSGRLLHQRLARPLALPQVWWTDGGHRKAHGCRNPTSFSTAAHCRMKRLSRTRTLRALRRAPYLCVLPQSKSLLPASSTLSTRYSFVLVSPCCLLPCSTAQSPQHSTPLSPPIQSP